MTALIHKPPFPWFGAKSHVADIIWQRLGKVKHYIEPFAGSAAVLLRNPNPARMEVLNDLDHQLANFWRAVKHQPKEVARWANDPVVHVELTARHRWLCAPERVATLREKLLDADWPGCAKQAGWWVWGISAWIGGGWCDQKRSRTADSIPSISGWTGVHRPTTVESMEDFITAFAQRLRHTKILNGSWDRCLNMTYGKSSNGVVGVFLDPPYKAFESVYSHGAPVASAVEKWAREMGKDKQVRICLAGHTGDYKLPGWKMVRWKRPRLTMGSAKTRHDEALYFSRIA